MKARVIKHLNIRTREPRVLVNNNPGFFNPNDTIEVKEAVDGDLHKGNRVWYKLDDGSFVWSGGVQLTEELRQLAHPLTSLPFPPLNLVSKIRFRNLAQLSSKGAGGVVALLDSGISNTLLAPRIVLAQDFIEPGPGPHALHPHGTQMAGLIGGNGPVITAFSSQCSLMSFRVSNVRNSVNDGAVLQALEAIVNLQQPVDVINMSIDVTPDAVAQVQTLVDALLAKGTIAVVAAGNANTLNNVAGIQNVVRVCAIKEDLFARVKSDGLSPVYHGAFIDTPLLSTTLNDTYETASKVSPYTAVVSGCLCALLRAPQQAQLKGRARLDAALKFLSNAAFALTDELSPHTFKLLKP